MKKSKKKAKNRFERLARRSTGPAAMVLGKEGHALLFSLGGKATDAEVLQAKERGYQFAGVLAVVNGRIEHENAPGQGLAMFQALKAFVLAVAECSGSVQ
jgi:hypothetical protein